MDSRAIYAVLLARNHCQLQGEAYSVKDGVWVKEKPTRQARHHVLLAKFKQSVDLSGTLFTAGLEREHSFQFHLLSELAGSLNENGVSSIGEIVESAERAGKVPALVAWIRAIKYTVFAIVGLIVAVGITYAVIRFRAPICSACCGMFRRLRNRCCDRKPRTVVTGDAARVGGVGAPEEDGDEVIKLYPDRAEFHLPSHYHVLSSQDGNPG
jgi:hypothetical protein